MDVESPSVQIRNFMTRVPPGVVDIDAISDPLKCPQYAQEICDYLQVIKPCKKSLNLFHILGLLYDKFVDL